MKAFRAAFLVFALVTSLPAFAELRGSICLAPTPERPTAKAIQSHLAQDAPYEFELQISGLGTFVPDSQRHVLLGQMDTEATRTVVIRNHGQRIASFRIRYSDYSEDDMCLFFNDLYQTWSFVPVSHTRICRCERIGSDRGEAAGAIR